MKISSMILMAGAVFALASCGGNSETTSEVEEVVMKTLSVDTDASTLGWKGMKNAEYFHTGTVKFTEGSAEFIDGNLTSGTFTVDMNSIVVTDALPDDKKEMLKGHLASPDFFDAAKNAKVKITTGAIVDGKLPVTVMMSGMELSQDVPVKVNYTDEAASIKGTFDFDFSALNAPGFQPKEGETEFVQPKVTFELNIELK